MTPGPAPRIPPGADHVAAGVRLHVVTYGHAERSTVPALLVHGLGATSSLWSEVIADLGAHVLTVAPDLAGTGRSELRPGRLDLAGQAVLLRALLDRMGHPQVVVAGHGLGGAVAVHLAALAPGRVAGLVLVSTPVHEDAWPTPADLPWLLPFVRTLWPAGPRRVARAVDMVGVQTAWETLTAAPPPALVCWGDRDRTLSPSYGRRVAGELPGAAWVPVADAGHMLPVERPERLAEEIAGFSAEVAG